MIKFHLVTIKETPHLLVSDDSLGRLGYVEIHAFPDDCAAVVVTADDPEEFLAAMSSGEGAVVPDYVRTRTIAEHYPIDVALNAILTTEVEPPR